MYWDRKKNGVYVYISKNKQVPRVITKHLDFEELDSNIDYWVQDYEKKLKANERKLDPQFIQDSFYTRYVTDFLDFLKSEELSQNTMKRRERMLYHYNIPYFRDHCSVNDFNAWPNFSPKIRSYLTDAKVGEWNIKYVNETLSQFWDYLQSENVVLSNATLKTRPAKIKKQKTLLKRLITPKEVLTFAKTAAWPYNFIALVGYFFSLRPNETFGLKKSDFVAGSRCEMIECSKVMKKYDLYSKLIVHVQRQRNDSSMTETIEPKVHSIGWVGCFNE